MTPQLYSFFLHLLHAGLHNESPHTSVSISETEWEEVYAEAHRQTVQGILYDAVCRMPAEQQPKASLLNSWAREVEEMEVTWHRHLMTINYLTVRCQAEMGLVPIVLKGLAVAEYYLRPSHRACGDIDVYYGTIRDVRKADGMVRSWGIPVQQSEHESVYSLNGVVVEHHGYLVESHVGKAELLRQEVEEKCKKGELGRSVLVGGSSIAVLTSEYEGLLLFSHSFKHLLNEGIGFRQMCDVAMFLKVHGRHLSGNDEFASLLMAYGIKPWADMVLSFCASHLGLKKESFPYPLVVSHKKANKLLKEIFRRGNMGAISERKRLQSQNIWKCKLQTIGQICRNITIFGVYAPRETWGWFSALFKEEIKQLLLKSNKKAI